MEKEVRGYFSSRISFGPQGKMVNHISLKPLHRIASVSQVSVEATPPSS
jgi:hypothetical protein